MSVGAVLWLICLGGGLFDAYRRPRSQWVAADRNRAFWVVWIVLIPFLGTLVYLIGVVPKFPRGSSSSTDSAFLR